MKPTSCHTASIPRGCLPALRFFSVVCGFAALDISAAQAAGIAPPLLETNGFVLVATPSTGTQLVYTLNGVDPRGPNGQLALGAHVTASPLVVAADALLAARAWNPTAGSLAVLPWSELRLAADATRVGADSQNPLFASRLSNLSTLVTSGLADATPITGFVVTGSDERMFLIRAVGPALSAFGVPDALADPEFVLRSADGTVISRTSGWTADPMVPQLSASVGAFPLPDASADCATIAHLQPGAYTIQITSRSGTAGTALAELYDLDRSSGFVGLSARAAIGPGHRLLTTGFVVEGAAPKKILVRAIGPSLAIFGVNGALTDPSLKIYSGSTVIGQNDDWDGAAEISGAANASGAFHLPVGSKDSAVVVTLAPGAYTAQVTCKGSDAGVVLLEVYGVP